MGGDCTTSNQNWQIGAMHHSSRTVREISILIKNNEPFLPRKVGIKNEHDSKSLYADLSIFNSGFYGF
jgi:hypothetical protein